MGVVEKLLLLLSLLSDGHYVTGLPVTPGAEDDLPVQVNGSAFFLSLVECVEGLQAAGGAAEKNTKAWLDLK